MKLRHGPGLVCKLRGLARDERGATAIEYGLICALLALVIIAAMTTVFNRIGSNFNSISNNLTH